MAAVLRPLVPRLFARPRLPDDKRERSQGVSGMRSLGMVGRLPAGPSLSVSDNPSDIAAERVLPVYGPSR